MSNNIPVDRSTNFIIKDNMSAKNNIIDNLEMVESVINKELTLGQVI